MLQTKNYYVFAFQPYQENFNFGGRHIHVYIWMNWMNMRFFSVWTQDIASIHWLATFILHATSLAYRGMCHDIYLDNPPTCNMETQIKQTLVLHVPLMFMLWFNFYPWYNLVFFRVLVFANMSSMYNRY